VALVDEVAIVAACEAEVLREGGEVVKELEKLEEDAREGTGARFGEGRSAGGLTGIDAGGAGEDDVVAHFFEGIHDAGDVDGFRAGAPGAEVVEDGHLVILLSAGRP